MRIFIGLGSNLDNPIEQIETAVTELQNSSEIDFVQCSSLYRSPPMGPKDQPDFINAVAECETELSPLDLLRELQGIEQSHGRVKKRHWGERTLDLDLLVYGDQVIDQQQLKVPHPGIAQRAFVLYPLAEIAADITLPKFGAIKQLLTDCPLEGLQRIETD